MCSAVALLHGKGKVPGSTLALSDEEGPVLSLFVKHLLSLRPRDLSVKPPDAKEGPLINATTSKGLFSQGLQNRTPCVYTHQLRGNTHSVD